MKKLSLIVLSLAFALGIFMTSCGGPSDEEVIEDLSMKFMIALFKNDTATAREICNDTGYETFELVGGMVALSTGGLAASLDEAALAGKIDVADIKMMGENKGIARVIINIGDDIQTVTVPCEKDAKGDWKVAITKQCFG